MLSRRHVLEMVGLGTAAALAGPVWSASPAVVAANATANQRQRERLQREAARAPRLREGDVLGLVAPAGFVGDHFGVEEIAATVRAMGLVPRLAPNLTARAGYLAGSDAARADDLMAMFADDEVRAVMAVRGGWGTARILPLLDFAAIAAKPKLFCGFSDNTALHLALAAHHCAPSIHGPNASASWNPFAWDSFRALAFEGATPRYAVERVAGTSLRARGTGPRTFHGGKAQGRLLGGNLTVLSALCGTPYLPDFTGAILFLEDTNESEYRIDRMLTQLALAGVLDKVAGIAFGQCTGCHNPDGGFSNYTLYEVLDDRLGKLGVPAFQGLSFGHIANQLAIPVGVEARIDADAGTLDVLEAVVA